MSEWVSEWPTPTSLCVSGGGLSPLVVLPRCGSSPDWLHLLDLLHLLLDFGEQQMSKCWSGLSGHTWARVCIFAAFAAFAARFRRPANEQMASVFHDFFSFARIAAFAAQICWTANEQMGPAR